MLPQSGQRNNVSFKLVNCEIFCYLTLSKHVNYCVMISCHTQASLNFCLCRPWGVWICLSVCTSVEQRSWKAWQDPVLPEHSWRHSASRAAPTLGSVSVFVQSAFFSTWNCVCVKNAWGKTPRFFLLSLQDLAVFSLTQLLADTLRELDLTSCVNVTDLSVRSIATYLQRLVVLRLSWCKEITDWGLLGIVETTSCEPDQETVRSSGMFRV